MCKPNERSRKQKASLVINFLMVVCVSKLKHSDFDSVTTKTQNEGVSWCMDKHVSLLIGINNSHNIKNIISIVEVWWY
jgi:hypothetical protein